MYPQYMCILLYVTQLFGVMVFYRCIVNWIVGGICILSICAFCDIVMV